MRRREPHCSGTAARTMKGLAVVSGILLAVALVLHGMGRSLWCKCGNLSPWSWDIWSTHNSQHLIDPYTLTHVEHGLLFYGLLRLILGGRRPAVRAILALGGEGLWEIVENTNRVIESYRESTISLNYYGDSILNSLADVLAFGAGYSAASVMAAWISAAAFFGAEILLLLTIRDSLLLNILMLLHPIEAIKHWQTGG